MFAISLIAIVLNSLSLGFSDWLAWPAVAVAAVSLLSIEWDVFRPGYGPIETEVRLAVSSLGTMIGLFGGFALGVMC
ncbi:MAG: hypothetical protein MO846_11665 [Candidatus Devosia symbiotica]|nr:hypothetical protein [Candidatus Devosia symbiotica]